MLGWFRRRGHSSTAPAATANPSPAPVAPPTPPSGGAAEIPRDKIEARAYEIWVRKGKPHGQDLQNWTEAETELRAEFAARPGSEPLPRKSR